MVIEKIARGYHERKRLIELLETVSEQIEPSMFRNYPKFAKEWDFLHRDEKECFFYNVGEFFHTATNISRSACIIEVYDAMIESEKRNLEIKTRKLERELSQYKPRLKS